MAPFWGYDDKGTAKDGPSFRDLTITWFFFLSVGGGGIQTNLQGFLTGHRAMACSMCFFDSGA